MIAAAPPRALTLRHLAHCRATVAARLSKKYATQDLAVQEPDIEATVRDIYEHKLLSGAFSAAAR